MEKHSNDKTVSSRQLNTSLLRKVLRVAGSLRICIIVSSLLVVILAVATFIENKYGTEAVRFAIYDAWWFLLLAIAFGSNVLAATLSRWPWQKRHVPFLITHSGILILLLGCLLSQLWGIDARLTIPEGSATDTAYTNRQFLELTITSWDTQGYHNSRISIPFNPGPFSWSEYSSRFSLWKAVPRSRGLVYNANGIKIRVLDYVANARLQTGSDLVLNVRTKQGEQRQLTLRPMPSPHMPGISTFGDRQKLPNAGRVVFCIASSAAEAECFHRCVPTSALRAPWELILFHAGNVFHFTPATLPPQKWTELPGTGLQVRLTEFNEQFLAVHLEVTPVGHPRNREPEKLVLFADLVEFNKYDTTHGVFGALWCDAAKFTTGEQTNNPDSLLSQFSQPRIDLLQAPDGGILYRCWHSPRLFETGKVSPQENSFTCFAGTPYEAELSIAKYEPHNVPGAKILPLATTARSSTTTGERWALVELEVDGQHYRYWLSSKGPMRRLLGNQLGTQALAWGKQRVVELAWQYEKVKLGLQVHLHNFKIRMEPGSRMPAHYASIVDLRTPDGKIAQEKTRVTLNHPLAFRDPIAKRTFRLYQEAYNGPFRPGDGVFETLWSNAVAQGELFVSILSLNYDPGRGLKYLGSLAICVGILLMIWKRHRARNL